MTQRQRIEYRTVTAIPPARAIQWAKAGDAIGQLTRALLSTVGTGRAVSLGMDVFHFRLFQAVRARLYTRGCSLRMRSDTDQNRLVLWASVTNRPGRLAWQKEEERWQTRS